MHVHGSLRYTFILSQLKVHGNGRELTYQHVITVGPFDSHDPCVTHIVNMQLSNIRTSHSFYDFRAFNDDCKSRISLRLICRAFDQQLESCVEKYTGRLQVCCSYLLASTSLSFSFSFSPSFLRLAVSFSCSHSPAFPTFAPSFPRCGALEFAKLIARDRSPRISSSVKNALIYICT